MSTIKLGLLPDRTPVKVTLHLPPDLHSALQRYGELYEQTYGRREPLGELIAAMLLSYLESDRAFSRGRKGVDQ